MGTDDLSREMLFLKACNFASYKRSETCYYLNEPQYSGHTHFDQNRDDFVTRHYTNVTDPEEKDYLERYESLKTQIATTREKLIASIKDIKDLL